MKTFRFMLGEIALVVAIAYAFLTTLAVRALDSFIVTIWFAFISINFAQVT